MERMDDPQRRGRCNADGGCNYLRSLALFEGLAGFDLTARAFEAIAARCDQGGCWRRPIETAYVASAESVAPAVLSLKTRSRPRMRTECERVAAREDPIPFSRTARFDIIKDGSGNSVEHRRLQTATLDPADSLGYLYGYWRGLTATTPCALSNIDALHLIRARIIGKLHIVNVDNPDPAQFSYELFGYGVPIEVLAKPAAISVAIWREKILRDYNTARLSGRPFVERIRAHLQGSNYHYTRLILPFFDRRQRVSHLAIAIRREVGDGRTLLAD
jgi:hypothetical protein